MPANTIWSYNGTNKELVCQSTALLLPLFIAIYEGKVDAYQSVVNIQISVCQLKSERHKNETGLDDVDFLVTFVLVKPIVIPSLPQHNHCCLHTAG